MNTIELQLEVTRFLHRCESAASSKALQTGAPPTTAGASSPPPTLFGGSAVKVEVACKVESWLCSSHCCLGTSRAGVWINVSVSCSGDAGREEHRGRVWYRIQGHPGKFEATLVDQGCPACLLAQF